jgi:hypothetical protein
MSTVAHWRRVCQSHARKPLIKRAELGGDGQSVPFEQSLANLAHAYLKDRAPQLLDYELGFQLLEKNEDNDRAVGVFGFKVGPQLLYAPVFFLNGELKGHELMYLKESDTFVPMKENWVNYVLNRKPNIIGEEVAPDLGQLGVERPSMDIFRESPMKYGSATPKWLQPGLPGLMHTLGNPTRPPLQVPSLVKENADMANRFLRLIDSYPQLAQPIIDVYGVNLVKEAIACAKTSATAMPRGKKKKKKRYKTGSVFQSKTAADKARDLLNSKLKIWWYDDSTAVRARHCADGLTEKQAQELKRDGVFVSDERTDDEVSHAYRVQEPLSLQNPDDTGVYEVLCKPDSFERCLYIHAPFNARGTKPNGVLIKLDGDGKAWTETHSGNIYVSDEYQGETYRDWFDDLSDSDSLSEGGMYVLLAPNGQGTSVFEVLKSQPAEGDEKCYTVRWRNRYGGRRPDHLPPVAERRYEYDSDFSGEDSVVLNRVKGNRFVARLCALYAPTGTKVLKIKGPPEKDDEDDSCCAPTCCEYGESSDPPALRPGNHVDLQMGIYKTSEELRVFNNGTEAVVNGTRTTPLGAMVHLISEYGLREKAARDILKQAEAKGGTKCRVKLAQPYEALGYPPSAPSFPEPQMGTDQFMGSGVPATYGPDIQEMPVDGLQSARAQPNMAAPPDPMMAQSLAGAAQVGQKEVLDTSMLSNLLKGTQNETLIDRHLSNLMKGLDSLGRLLFNMYWHHDKFEDRYGGNNLPELTDAMRNAFESLGDVTLELKQKTIEPYPDEGISADFGEGEQ